MDKNGTSPPSTPRWTNGHKLPHPLPTPGDFFYLQYSHSPHPSLSKNFNSLISLPTRSTISFNFSTSSSAIANFFLTSLPVRLLGCTKSISPLTTSYANRGDKLPNNL